MVLEDQPKSVKIAKDERSPGKKKTTLPEEKTELLLR